MKSSGLCQAACPRFPSFSLYVCSWPSVIIVIIITSSFDYGVTFITNNAPPPIPQRSVKNNNNYAKLAQPLASARTLLQGKELP